MPLDLSTMPSLTLANCCGVTFCPHTSITICCCMLASKLSALWIAYFETLLINPLEFVAML